MKKNYKKIWIVIKFYYLYITKQTNIMTSEITTQKMNFIGNNEVKGWFKLTDGTKTNFHIQENGEVQQWGTSNNEEVHPIVIGLLEMLFSQE